MRLWNFCEKSITELPVPFVLFFNLILTRVHSGFDAMFSILCWEKVILLQIPSIVKRDSPRHPSHVYWFIIMSSCCYYVVLRQLGRIVWRHTHTHTRAHAHHTLDCTFENNLNILIIYESSYKIPNSVSPCQSGLCHHVLFSFCFLQKQPNPGCQARSLLPHFICQKRSPLQGDLRELNRTWKR